MDGVEIGEGARIRRAIVDKHVRVPAGAVIGYDPDADRERFAVSSGGIVVIPKGAQLD
jgi:glucose-1-phosphate adenylyltransferase